MSEYKELFLPPNFVLRYFKTEDGEWKNTIPDWFMSDLIKEQNLELKAQFKMQTYGFDTEKGGFFIEESK